MTETDLHPIFDASCDPEWSRNDLHRPFEVDGYIYATDGRIVVRCKATPETAAAYSSEGRKVPRSVISLFDDKAGEPVAMPDASGFPFCGRCQGKGELHQQECPKCQGSGEVECPRCGHEEDCEECDGEGVVFGGPTPHRCPDCIGTGVAKNPIRVGGLSNPMNAVYLKILLVHGATLYAPSATLFVPIPFTVGDDIEGRVMPMNGEGGDA